MVFIDDRTGSIELKRHFKGVSVEVQRLAFGDFYFIGNGKDDTPITVGIERKTLPDLLSSIASGRLVGHQIPGMINTYNNCILLIEGIHRGNPDTNELELYTNGTWKPLNYTRTKWRIQDMWNWVESLEEFTSFKVKYSTSEICSARMVMSMFHWWNKPYNKHTAMKAVKVEKDIKPKFGLVPLSPMARLYAELPGVGVERADALAKRFPSVKKLIFANDDDLCSVDGIGPVTAKKIQDFLMKGK